MFGLLPFEKWLLLFILHEDIREKLLKLALAVILNACLGKAEHFIDSAQSSLSQSSRKFNFQSQQRSIS